MSLNASKTTQNIALATLAAPLLVRFAEAHYGVKLSTDDALEYIGMAGVGWHVFVSMAGPYVQRVFDHFFPPPAPPAPTGDAK